MFSIDRWQYLFYKMHLDYCSNITWSPLAALILTILFRATALPNPSSAGYHRILMSSLLSQNLNWVSISRHSQQSSEKLSNNSFRLTDFRRVWKEFFFSSIERADNDDHPSEMGLSDAESVTSTSTSSAPHQWISVRLVRVEPDSVQLEWSSHPPSVRQQFVNCQARYGLLTPSKTFTQVMHSSCYTSRPIKE